MMRAREPGGRFQLLAHVGGAQLRFAAAPLDEIRQQGDPVETDEECEQREYRGAGQRAQSHHLVGDNRDLLVDQESQQGHQRQIEEARDRGRGVLNGVPRDRLAREPAGDAGVIAEVLEQVNGRETQDDEGDQQRHDAPCAVGPWWMRKVSR
ncbi:hypothetical protein WJ977_08225 [Achromobacter xylosoxidans]